MEMSVRVMRSAGRLPCRWRRSRKARSISRELCVNGRRHDDCRLFERRSPVSGAVSHYPLQMSGIPPIRQEITVTWEFPVVFTHALFSLENPLLAETLDRLEER